MSLKKAALLVFLFVLSFNTFAQTWELGLMGGGAGYMGDLNPNNPLKISGISVGALAKRNFDPYWGLRISYTYGKIAGDDAKSSDALTRQRNLNFKSSLNEISAIIDFNFLKYFAGGGDRKISPYLFAGIGGVVFNPTAKYQGKVYNLKEYTTEGQKQPYTNYVLAIPYGAGFRYNFVGDWSIFSEIGYRTAYSDYLDDVSGSYADLNTIPTAEGKYFADRTGAPYNSNQGVQRGDFRKRDTYMFVGIGITFTFVSSKCYRF